MAFLSRKPSFINFFRRRSSRSEQSFKHERPILEMPAAPALPDIALPKPPDPKGDPAGYLRSIYAVRERSKIVLEKAKTNELQHFNVDLSKFADTASFVVSIIKVASRRIRSSYG